MYWDAKKKKKITLKLAFKTILLKTLKLKNC